MKFGSFMQNITGITVMWSKLKLEEEFQYGGHLFFQNGNSYISAVGLVILMIFSLLIDIELLKEMTSPNPKPEVQVALLSQRGRAMLRVCQ